MNEPIQAGQGTTQTSTAADVRIAKLEKQIAWYRSFFEEAIDGLLIVQPDTWVVLDANSTAAAMLATSKADLVGNALPELRPLYVALSESSRPTIFQEITLHSPEKRERRLHVHAKLMQYSDRLLLQVVLRDMSEQQQLSEKLLQTDKMVLLGQLAADVAHEIRNPLAAVNLNLQLLQRKFSEGTTERTSVETALIGVGRIHKIVETTLNFSRPQPPQTKPEQINSVLVITLDMVASAFRRKTVSVQLDLAENLPPVHIDASQVQQVFINLLTNAADAIKTKGSVSIKTYTGTHEKLGGCAFVDIQDTGSGIKPDDISRIFEPFFTRKADGTGLGLPISKRIVEQHGGAITVMSEVEHGTTFTLAFPIRRAATSVPAR